MKTSILAELAKAPATQIEPHICQRIGELVKKKDLKSDELLDVMDDCVYGSLASGIAMTAMRVVWERMLADEGMTQAQALMAAEPRRSAKNQARNAC